VLVKPRREVNCRIRFVPFVIVAMMPLAMPSGLPRTIRSLIILAASSVPSRLPFLTPIAVIMLLRFGGRLTRRASWIEIELHRLLSRLEWTWRLWIIYTIWGIVSRGVLDMGRQRPRPTTRRSEDVLIARSNRGWSTHIVIGTTGLTVVRVMLLRWWMRVWIARIQIFVRRVDIT
jgi:hypothetical protein